MSPECISILLTIWLSLFNLFSNCSFTWVFTQISEWNRCLIILEAKCILSWRLSTPIFHGFHPQHNTISVLEKIHILRGFNHLWLSFKVLVKLKARLVLPSSGQVTKVSQTPFIPTCHVRTGENISSWLVK